MNPVLKIISLLLVTALFSGCFTELTKENADEQKMEENSMTQKRVVETVIQKDISTWIWDTTLIKDTPTLIAKLKAKNIKTAFLQVNYDVSSSYYKTFISTANFNNIKICALGGSPNWANSKYVTAYTKFFQWIAAYQASALNTEKFCGIHCDVEPYLLPAWDTSYQSTVSKYQDFVIYAVKASKSLGLELCLDIPFWFDGRTYKNTKYGSGNLCEWIIKNVDRISIMAYRDTASGINSIVSQEIAWVQQYNKKLTISVEMKEIDPVYITFFQEGETYMLNELYSVQNNFSSYSCFDSFGIHAYIV